MDNEKRIPWRILEAVLTSMWAILPEALPPIIRIAAREGDDALEAVRAELGQEMDNAQRVEIRDRVAVIPINGPIFRRANLFTQLSGATSVDVLASDFQAALDSPDVDAIMLEINSPGGQVDGVSEMAQLIYANRGKKTICAHIDGFGASAAYWIASAADKVTASDTSLIGSLGVISTHELPDGKDRTIEIVSSQSPLKSVDVMTPKGRARIQRMVDDTAGVFIAAAAKYRSRDVADVLANFGKGDVLIADRALRAGMIDTVGTFEEAFARLVGRPVRVYDRFNQVATADYGAFTTYLTDQLTKGQTGTWSAASGGWQSNIQTLAITLAGGDAKEGLDDGGSVELKSKPEPAADAVDEEVVDMEEKEIAAAKAEAVTKERERVTVINAVAGEYAHIISGADGLATKAIQAGLSVDEFRAELQANLPKAGELPQPGTDAIGITGVDDKAAQKPFTSMGEQLQVGARTLGKDPRLQEQVAQFHALTGHSETVPAEGGFLLQDDFVQGIEKIMHDNGQVFSRCNERTVGPQANALVYTVIDESSRADGSRRGGIRGYWVGEGEAPTKSKLGLRQDRLPLEKAAAVAYLTEEQLQDTVQIEGEINETVPEELLFKVEDAIIEGDGAGKCLGLKNSDAVIEVSKEAGQAAATIVFENINKMYARFWSKSMASPAAAWFINQDVIPQLDAMFIGTGTAGTPVYMPPGGLADRRYGTLKGLPVIPIEFCETLGTAGDILLTDMSQYRIGTKGGVQSSISVHVKFEEGEVCFRFFYRINGQPMWKKALTPFKGTNTVSPFVRLAARA